MWPTHRHTFDIITVYVVKEQGVAWSFSLVSQVSREVALVNIWTPGTRIFATTCLCAIANFMQRANIRFCAVYNSTVETDS